MKRLIQIACCVVLVLGAWTLAVRGQQAGIHDAARAGTLPAVQELVAKNPELAGAKDEAGRTALHLASGGGHVDVVAYLLACGAEVDAGDNTRATSLHLAAAAGHDDIARLLIEKKADVNARDAGGETPLSKACVRGRVTVAGRLLAAGAALETPNSYGRTPLMLVARESGNAELARLLLEGKADVAVRDKFGDTALTLAAWRGFRPVVDLLLERGAAIPSEPRARGQLLRQAARGALDSLFARLLDLAVSRPADNAGTRSLLHDAAAGGSVRILERLVAAAPNVNQADGDGWTPLHDAAFMDRRDAVRFLLDKGADPNVRNRLGQSPWNLAVEHKRDSVADLLAARGAACGAPQFPALSGDYLGQKPPGRVPEVFAPGIVGGHFQLHSSIVFSPDGSEAYWSEMVPRTTPGYGTNRTMTSRRVEGRWRYPEVAVLGSTPLDDVPLVSADGTRIYDMSRRPLPGETGSSPKENIWVADRAGTGWSEPKPLDQAVNALPHHWQFAVDTAGGVYFSSNWKGAGGLFHARLVNGRHGEPVPLGAPVNATGGEAMPFIAQDGSYLLFSRDMDLWVSFRGPDGHWKTPVALPSPINTPDTEICPVVSPDGRYLFFLRGELYWVDAGIIEDLRPGAATAKAKPVINVIGMQLVEIPGGSFDMGSPIGPGEAPVHRVSVRSFWLGATEVTQAQWRAVMGNNPSHFKAVGPNAPVEMVTWEDAQAFVRKLSEREPGWRYRLPSEAEWEYACLGGTAKDPYGPGEDIAWIQENSGGTTHPVGLKRPNAFGLYDMFGNVPEWTQDSWHDSHSGAPTDGSAREAGGTRYHTLKGGGWDLPAFFLHAALRGPYGEIHRRGFRVAADRR